MTNNAEYFYITDMKHINLNPTVRDDDQTASNEINCDKVECSGKNPSEGGTLDFE